MSSENFTWPWCCICRLKNYFKDGHEELASGWVVNLEYVVTAAHCVNDANHGGLVKRVEVWAGLRNNSAAGKAESKRVVSAPRWGNGGDQSWDLAVIELKNPFHSSVEWLPTNPELLTDPHGLAATIAGYDPKLAELSLSAHTNVELGVAGHRLTYAINSHKGMSGSPILIEHGGIRWVVGVHTHGSGQPTQGVFLDKERARWVDGVAGWLSAQ